MPAPLDAFAIAAPGLSDLLAAELTELGITPAEVSPAGVAFSGDLATLYRANLQSRIASRVVVRVAAFEAAHFSTLEKRLRAVEWARWIAPARQLSWRVTCRKSRLYHSGAVAERLQEAINRQVAAVGAPAPVDEEDDEGRQLLVVRIDHDHCTISLDSSGALLHRRGYRQAVGKAPLRETLAAAMLRAAHWRGTCPLVDPMCGSGTLAIEAAMVARRMAPGRSRSFAFESWPAFRPTAWRTLRDDARARELASCPIPIAASDRDAGAIEAATANASRADVAADVVFTPQALSAARPVGDTPGLLVSNPPWGGRVGEPRALRNLYAQFGKLARGPFDAWDLVFLATEPTLMKEVGVPLAPLFTTVAGGLRVTCATRVRD